ncbi:MAG: hypothetical protein ACJ8F7_04300, partial [Gemmataceae bacterium]
MFFDAVGTLLTPHPPAVNVYLTVGRRHGSRLSRPAITLRFREAFRCEEENDAVHGWATSEERERQRWSSIVNTVFHSDVATEDCFRELWDHFAHPDAWRVAAAAGEVVD